MELTPCTYCDGRPAVATDHYGAPACIAHYRCDNGACTDPNPVPAASPEAYTASR